MPQQNLQKPSGAAKTLESDDDCEADEASDSEPGSDSEADEDHDSDSDDAGELLTGHNNEAQPGTASSQDSLEERRAGMAAEISGQPGVTPGTSLLLSSSVVWCCCAVPCQPLAPRPGPVTDVDMMTFAVRCLLLGRVC